MKISLCVIAKNEEKNLPRCLASVEGVVAEKIVVDTGSTDRTVEIAKELGAKVFFYEWSGDFAQARNYAIKQAKGNWIIFLDADEYFLPESQKILKSRIELADQARFNVLIAEMTNYDTTLKKAQSIFKCVRVFKNDKQFHYEGKIHENLIHRNGKQKVVDDTIFLKLIHTGYSQTEFQRKNKFERNEELLLSELQENPGDGTLWFYLAETLMGIDVKRALDAARKALECDNIKMPSLRAKNYMNILTAMVKLGCSLTEAKELIHDASARHPMTPDFYFWQAELFTLEERTHDAIRVYEEGIKHLDNAAMVESAVYFSLAKRMHNMGALYCQMRQWDKGIKYLLEALRSDKFYFQATTLLVETLLRSDSPRRIIDFLWQLYDDSTKEKLYLLKVALTIGKVELVAYYGVMINIGQQPKLWKENAYLNLHEANYAVAATLLKENLTTVSNVSEEMVDAFLLAVFLGEKYELLDNCEIGQTSLARSMLMTWNVSSDDERELCLRLAHAAIRFNALDTLMEKFPWVIKGNSLWKYAELAFVERQYALVIKFYTDFIQSADQISDDELAGILGRLGESLYYQGQDRDALQFFQDAHKLGLKTYRSYEMELDLLIKNSFDEAAAGLARQALVHYPDSGYFLDYSNKENG